MHIIDRDDQGFTENKCRATIICIFFISPHILELQEAIFRRNRTLDQRVDHQNLPLEAVPAS